jgi:spore maturation protein CgeB
MARFFDVVFVAQKDYVQSYRQAVGHDQVYWLPLAAAPDIHRRHELAPIYDVAFVGSAGVAHRRTSSRLRRLHLLSARYKTNDVFAPAPAEEVGRIYSQARIVFNTSIAGDVTMRDFEATACGALLVTDSAANGLAELFEIGKEVVVFGDDQELLEKIDYYLAHEQERRAIAEAGFRRTHGQHTYQHRVRQILATLETPGLRQAASMRWAGPAAVAAERRAIYTGLHMLDALYDDARAAQLNALQRTWSALPALARRTLR